MISIKYIDENLKRKEDIHRLTKEPTTMKDEVCMLNISRNEEQKYLDKFWNGIKIANQMIYKYNIKGIYRNRLQMS